MTNYKGWTAEERQDSLKLTKQAIKSGSIPKPCKCNRCGQDEGIIDYHNEDYSHPTKYLEQLCFVCHLIHHSERRNPIGRRNYFAAVAFGYRAAPAYTRSLGIIAQILSHFQKGKI